MIEEKDIEAWRERRAEVYASEKFDRFVTSSERFEVPAWRERYNNYLAGARDCAEVDRLVGRIEGLHLAIKQLHTIDSSDSSHGTVESCQERMEGEITALSSVLAALLGKAGA